MGQYLDQYKLSLEQPEKFWATAADSIDWTKKWDRVLDDSNAPIYRWFTGGKLNTCYNALDRHVLNGRANQAALIYDSPVSNTKKTYNYQELLEKVSRLAGVLTDLGVEKGDREGSRAQMMRNYAFFGAPHVAIISTPKALGPYGALDCGAYVTAFTLAAEALGIATIPQAAIAEFSQIVREEIDLDETRDVLCVISFGYADPDHPANQFRTRRAGLDEVVDWRE